MIKANQKRFQCFPRVLGVVFFLFVLSGCATTLRKSLSFDSSVAGIKTIAVLPPDVKVYKLTAGGITELIDEWSEEAKNYIEEALTKHMGQRYAFKMKFISDGWIKQNHFDLWNSNKSLYESVAYSALFHAYPGPHAFGSKLKNFDYTLGTKAGELARACGVDSLLFVHGVDYEATAGRTALLFWNILMSAATGVAVIPITPTFMNMGLVDGISGDVVWFKVIPSDAEYSFRSKGHVDTLIEWLTRDFISEKK